jgi:hypothetical protein
VKVCHAKYKEQKSLVELKKKIELAGLRITRSSRRYLFRKAL